LDEVNTSGIITNAVEIPNLQITAKTSVDGQKINTTSSSLGVTVYGSGDDQDRFDPGEIMILSFDKQIEITEIDLIGFNSNSVFTLEVAGRSPIEIGYDDLSNKGSQLFTTNLTVDANTDIQFYVGNTNSVIGLQSMDVSVLGGTGELLLSMESSNSMMFVNAEFDGAAITNYVLQSSTNLTSNVWNTVSSSFSSDTNWVVEVTNGSSFYRAIAQ
jgi:hypothetical protein